MELKEKIVNIREDNNLTQEEFAEKLFVSRQSISNWENGKCYPDLETILLISDMYDISLDVLLKEDREMVKVIDKSVRKGKYRWWFFGMAMILSSVLFWYTYKTVLDYRRQYYDVAYLDECVNNASKITLTTDRNAKNMRFGEFNYYLPEDLICDETETDVSQRVYVKEGIRAIWISFASADWDYTSGFDEMSRFLGYGSRRFLESNDFDTPEKILDYYRLHEGEEPNIFWSRNRLLRYHFVHQYVEGIAHSYGCELYSLESDDWFGILYVSDNYYVAELQCDGDFYYMRFNKSLYLLDDVKESLSMVYFD